jgi:hypothetical protein
MAAAMKAGAMVRQTRDLVGGLVSYLGKGGYKGSLLVVLLLLLRGGKGVRVGRKSRRTKIR